MEENETIGQKRAIPLWEVSLTLFSIYVAGLLFIFPDLLEKGEIYPKFTEIAPQIAWAFIFTTGALVKAIGLIFNITSLRIAGLIISVILYSIIAFCYASGFPNLSTGLFVVITFMSLLTIFYVKITEL